MRVRPDYSEMELERLGVPWSTSPCTEFSPVDVRTKVVAEVLQSRHPEGVGNRLVLLHCPNRVIEHSSYTSIQRLQDCGNVAGILFHDTDALLGEMKGQLMAMISRGQYSEDGRLVSAFGSGLCSYVRTCIASVPTILGQYLAGDERQQSAVLSDLPPRRR